MSVHPHRYTHTLVHACTNTSFYIYIFWLYENKHAHPAQWSMTLSLEGSEVRGRPRGHTAVFALAQPWLALAG